jgi:hypothetical protein
MADAGTGRSTCPAGHDSASSDFCDVCGMRISGAQAPPQAPAGPAADPCPQCGTAKSGRFCESCGFDFDAGPGQAAPPASVPATAAQAPRAVASWTAVVGGDRAYYEQVVATGGPDAAGIAFPAYCPERRFQLAGPEMRIGRRSASRGIEPEIDLTGPPADPGVSRLHAVLVVQPDGSWVVLDPGSENGLMVNDTAVTTGVPVQLHDGDRIHLGAWTVITIASG